MRELIKQPNGKYCRCDWDGELEFYNCTEQDIIDMHIKQAKEEIKNASFYGKLIEQLEDVHWNIDDILKSMGYDKPYTELIKYVPQKPFNQSYAPCDFTTYAKCPNCGDSVKNGMRGKDEKCSQCGQMLKW